MPSAEEIYRFRHALMRQAAYDMQLPAERARLHALVLELTEKQLGQADAALEPLAAELADHARSARGIKRTGLVDDAYVSTRELRFLALAQRKALRDHNLPEAIQLARRQASMPEAEADYRCDANLRLATALRMATDFAAALVAAQKALQLAPDAAAQGAAQLELSANFLRQGNHDAAEQAAEQAMEIARALHDTRLEAGALATLGNLRRMGGRTAEAQLILQRAISVAAEAKAPDIEGISRIHLGHLLGISGQPHKAREHLATALRLLEKTDRTVHRVDALNYLFDQAFEQGQLIVAGKYLQQAEQIARELGYRVGLSQTCVYKAMLEDARGDKPAALAALQEAASIARELGDDRNLSVALGNLGNVQLEQGYLQGAEASYQESGLLAQRTGNAYAQAHAWSGVARVRQAQGKHHEAWGHYEHAVQLMELAGLPREVLRLQRKLARAQQQAGDTQAARSTLQQVLQAAAKAGDHPEQAAAQEQLATLAAPGQAP